MMKYYRKITNILVIFLLLCFVLPGGQMIAQDGGYMPIKEIEGESNENGDGPYIAKEGDPVLPDELNLGNYGALFPVDAFKKVLSDEVSNSREELGENENRIKLLMSGKGNNVTTTQKGRGNMMDLGVDGNSNKGLYVQDGNKNYIFDRIVGNNQSREIIQEGDGNAIENRGMQTTPMIIKQRGKGMKLKITGFK